MPSTGPAAGRILVVDDQPANLRVVSALLTRHGYEVLSASDGEAALELAATQVPDLMLLDMMMPGMDGFELITRIKQQPELGQVPVVFLTAAQDRDMPSMRARWTTSPSRSCRRSCWRGSMRTSG